MFLAFGALFFIIGCQDRITAEQVRSTIDRELAFGASSKEIEAFLVRHDWPFTYDQYGRKYQSTIRDVSRFTDKAIAIDLYVDSEKKFVRHEVRDSYRMP